MRCLIALLCWLTLAVPAVAADNPFKQAKTAIKTKKGLDEAEKALTDYAQLPGTRHDDRAQAYGMAAQVAQRIHEAENEKMYLKRSPDSLRFFSSLLRMYSYVRVCDSIEATVNESGKRRVRYARQNKAMRDQHRRNLLQGAIWSMRNRNYAAAYTYYDTYCTSDTLAFAVDTLRHRVANWTTTCAYATGNMRGVLKYCDVALQGTSDSTRVLEYKSRAQMAVADTAGCERTLVEGMTTNPSHTYFFLTLFDYLRSVKRYHAAVDYARRAIAACPDMVVYHYALCLSCFEMNDDDGCIEATARLLLLDNNFADAHLLRALCLVDKAEACARKACYDVKDARFKDDRQELTLLYSNALVPAEKYRELRPDDSAKWAPILYKIYYNLNMGRKLAEVERIMRTAKQP